MSQININSYLKLEELEKLPTKYLLGIFKKTRILGFNNICSCGCGMIEDLNYDKIIENNLTLLKKLLKTREHIETNKNRTKKIRQYSAKHKVSKEEAINKLGYYHR